MSAIPASIRSAIASANRRIRRNRKLHRAILKGAIISHSLHLVLTWHSVLQGVEGVVAFSGTAFILLGHVMEAEDTAGEGAKPRHLDVMDAPAPDASN